MPKSTVRNKTKKLPSRMRRAMDIPLASSLPNSQAEQSKLLYRACDVNMKQFKACICHSDLQQLVVSGQPKAEEIAEAWASLFYEYCDLIEATETIYKAMLAHEIQIYKKHNTLAAEWVKIMQLEYTPALAAAIKELGFDYDLDPTDAAEYQSQLLRINNELSFHRMTVKMKEAEYAAILENQSTHDTIDEKYFSTIFFRINNYAKREAVNGLTTVEDYCAALKDYVAYCKLNNPQS